MSDSLESKRKRVESLSVELDRVQTDLHHESDKRWSIPRSPDSPFPPPSQREEQLTVEQHRIGEQLDRALTDLHRIEARQTLNNARKNENLAFLFRHGFLILGVASLAGLAYLFRQNYALAAIPLVGLVALLVLWPIYEKFRQLQRVEAEFTTQGINVAAAASETDEYLRLQGEVAKRKVELELAKINREITDIHSSSAERFVSEVDKENKKEESPEPPRLLSSPKSESES